MSCLFSRALCIRLDSCSSCALLRLRSTSIWRSCREMALPINRAGQLHFRQDVGMVFEEVGMCKEILDNGL